MSPGNGNLNKVPLGGGSMDPDVLCLEDMDNQYMCKVTVHLTAVCTVHSIVHRTNHFRIYFFVFCINT